LPAFHTFYGPLPVIVPLGLFSRIGSNLSFSHPCAAL
jgi:hypothetical protein